MKAVERIKTIARNVRKWAEQEAAKDDFDSETLACFCARGAAELFRQLRLGGFKPNLVLAVECMVEGWATEAHVYVRCGGYVVDITASQFGRPNIVVRREKSVMQEKDAWYWTSVQNTFISVAALRQNQKRTGWPEEQIAR